MKKFDIGQLRNLALVGHGGCGKTSVTSGMLFSAKATSRLGKVDDGTAITDYEEEELRRKISIGAASAHCQWKDSDITVLDTPGFGDFILDARSCLHVADSAVLVVCSVAGVEVFTEKVWEFADEFDLPRVVFINKLDRERASFDRTLEGLKEAFAGANFAVLTFPMGCEANFSGLVDVVEGRALVYKKDGSGAYETTDVPDEFEGTMSSYRESLIEAVAETDDQLIEEYLETGELPPEKIVAGLKKGIVSGQIVPILCGAATMNVGTVQLLDLAAASLPSPSDRPPVSGTLPASGEEAEREPDPSQPFMAYVFKTIADPYAGKINLFRVYSGSLSSDSSAINGRTESAERVGQLYRMQGKKQVPVDSVGVGEIAAVAKLKDTGTGDTLYKAGSPFKIASLPRPNPMVFFAVVPKTKVDEDKINLSMTKLVEEDPSLNFERNIDTQQQIISGMGQVHIEVTVEKLKRKFNVSVDLSYPKVAYKETIKKKVQVQGKYKKQTGGRGQYGDTWLEIEPLSRGQGFVFEDRIVGGVIPRNFIPSCEKGIIGAMGKGPLADYPVVDLKVGLYDGSHHAVDSSDMAFQIAASMGFKKGVAQANPVLLEPIMTLDVIVPDEFMGDIMGDINSRRGKIMGMNPKGRNQLIKAQVPMAELLKYAPDLTSMTGGRGTYSMEFSHYEEVPGQILSKVIQAIKPEEEAE